MVRCSDVDIATPGRRLIAALALLTVAQAGIASHSSLIGPEWAWEPASVERVGPDASRYTIRFASDGTMRVRADCNRGSGRFAVDGERLSLSAIATTKKGCGADSMDRQFLRALAEVVSYRLVDRRLLLTLGSGERLHLRENA